MLVLVNPGRDHDVNTSNPTSIPVSRMICLVALLACAAAIPAESLAKGNEQSQGKGKSHEQSSPGAGAVVAKDKGKGKGKGKGKEERDEDRGQEHAGHDHGKWNGRWDADELSRAGFDRKALLDALVDDRALLSTGAKPLPPGIRKRLARGKPLPPGIARRRPGADLLARLPRVEEHEWIEAGTDLVLVTVGAAVVKHILRDVMD